MNSSPPRYFMLRQRRDGPLVPARVWWCDYEPGAPDNTLDRGRLTVYPRADIGGLEVDPEIVIDRLWSHEDHRPGYAQSHWKYPQPITETEYRYQLQRLRWAERNRPDDPTLTPGRSVNSAQLPLPSFDREAKILGKQQ